MRDQAHLQHGRYTVLPRQLEVMWPDGTAIALHPVQENGIDSLFLRAVIAPNGLRIVFDLRRICPVLDADLRRTHERDVPGVVFYTLRHHLGTAAELVMQASLHAAAVWLPQPAAEAMAVAA